MRSPLLPLAAGSILASLLACHTLRSPAQLPLAGPVTADTHLTLLQTTDLHDHASGEGPMTAGVPGPVGSYARIAAYVNAIRQAAPADSPVVLVDSGDWTMGTIYDFTLEQQPLATYFLSTLRYDCATLGNHEFDYSTKGLAAILAASQSTFGFNTPIVASNLTINGDTYLAPYMGTAITPTFTETLSTGLKVGFIGLMGKAAAIDAPNATPATFTDYSQNYASIQALVTGLRTAQGCNVVIALNHAGTDVSTGGYTGEDVNLARNVTGIDVIASGHTHNPFGADGNASHPVTNGTWTTQIICAGAFSTNVTRIDLTYHATAGNTTMDAASNLAMTDATLASLPGSIGLDPAASVFVAKGDATLNTGLSLLLKQFFPDYSATNLNLGLYHPVGSAAQDMVSNGNNAVLNPNGLGNLCADALRAVPNSIINATLMAAGWNGNATSPTLATATAALAAQGYDPTPFTAAVVPTGIIRDDLAAGSPISFANAYDVLSLGITPDNSQSILVGYPLMSVYLSYPDLQKVCALQLVAQTNLTPSADYLNLSGLSYALNPAGAYTYFKYATAASVLQVITAKAASGSATAAKALTDLASLATDPTGATLLSDQATNPYVAAMAALNDPTTSLTQAQIAVNLPVMGTLAATAQADAANGTTALDTLILNKAIAAIGQLAGFAAADLACEAAPTALALNQRYRVAGDLYSIFMMNAIQAQFGVTITTYAGPTGLNAVAKANLTQALANRINLNGNKPALQELKAWMALMLYLTTPTAQGGFFTSGLIPVDYLSTATYTDFPTNGAAVTVRNADYPLPSVQQLTATLASLAAAS
jgi:2',3'-cyclic-nucleotide 2'-phosphodiesterase (5'-nucleotidase family)